ncbi:hypothetical protein MLD38_010212 [Melastoma candidum]|uniref:Uncharacterized protein n=1 Tax=Melastoma candidum TaxID=119954 RepID=A0ACB9R7G6_9MYRT|nr:hypothetical protein MLD38_010212 [Melastoma candidum]
MSVILNPFHLLELHIISAQDLSRVSRSMRTYAVTWIHPDRKLSTRVDTQGKSEPSWNDRFIFKVDNDFLCSETSAITIEIYSVHWLKDILVGTVRVIVDNLLPVGSSHSSRRQRNVGMQFAALQVRRPSGRPQGILNVGVAMLDGSRRSMPLYSEIGTSVTVSTNGKTNRLRSIVNENNKVEPFHGLGNEMSGDGGGAPVMPMLRRSKSESSSMEVAADGRKLKRRVSFRERLNSIISASEGSSSQDQKLLKGSSSTPASMVNGYYVSHPNENKKPDKAWKSGNDSIIDGSSECRSSAVKVTELHEGMMLVDLRDQQKGMKQSNSKKMITKSGLGVGLSASKMMVAAATRGRVPYRVVPAPNGSVALEGSVVTLSESMEGLQSKLERWRMELPMIYDKSDITSFSSSVVSSGSGGERHGRRHTDGGGQGGLFSCFSNICGCECSIVCGRGTFKDISPPRSRSRRRRRHSHSPTSHTYTMSI